MQQIYRRATMPKCDFNKVAKQLYWNHTSASMFSYKFAVYFQFSEHLFLWTPQSGCFCFLQNIDVCITHLPIFSMLFRLLYNMYKFPDWIKRLHYVVNIKILAEAYLESSRKSTWKIFAKIVDGWKALTIFARNLHRRFSTVF